MELREAFLASKLLGNGGGGGGGGLPEIETTTTVLVSEQSVTLADYQGLIAGAYSISVGDALTVSWDGVNYNCTVGTFNGMPVWGNQASVGGADTGEPFFMGYMEGTGIMIMAEDGSYTVGITGTSYSPASGSVLITNGSEWDAIPISNYVPHFGTVSGSGSITVSSGDIYSWSGTVSVRGLPAAWETATFSGYSFVTNGDNNPTALVAVVAMLNLTDQTATIVFLNPTTSSKTISGFNVNAMFTETV